MKKLIIMAMFGLMGHTAIYSQQQEEAKSGKGYIGIVDVVCGIGTGDYAGNQFGITMMSGYRFNPYFSLGAGLGVKFFPDPEMMYFPVFLNFRANLMKNKIAPIISVDHGFNMDRSVGGLYFNPNVGVRFRILGNFSMHLTLGYEMMKGINLNDYYPKYYKEYISLPTSLNSFIVKLGASF